MENKIPPYLLQNVPPQYGPGKIKKTRLSFLDKTLLSSARVVKSIYLQEENAAKDNFIQKINPYIKLFLLIYIVVVLSFVNNLDAQAVTSFVIFIFYITARLRALHVYKRAFVLAFIFGFIVVLPASLNIVTPGEIIFNLIRFNKPSHFWIYNIPQNIGFTENGIKVVLLVFLRVLNSVSVALLIVFTTPFPAFIKSFKLLGIPDTFLMVISLAYKYIFILSRTIEEMYLALKSRLSGNIKNKNLRNLVSGRIFFIFKRSTVIYENTYYAMISRGYRGKMKLHSHYHISYRDIISLVVVLTLGIIILLFRKFHG